MPTAYVLLNCDLGSEAEIIKKIKEVPREELVKLIGEKKTSLLLDLPTINPPPEIPLTSPQTVVEEPESNSDSSIESANEGSANARSTNDE